MPQYDTSYTIAVTLTVPFEEDDKDPSIWFLDHSYLENMFRMFKKVNGKQQLHEDSNSTPHVPCSHPSYVCAARTLTYTMLTCCYTFKLPALAATCTSLLKEEHGAAKQLS